MERPSDAACAKPEETGNIGVVREGESRNSPGAGSRPVRVIVCGGRDFSDTVAVARALDSLHAERPIGVVFHGNAAGADRAAHWWAYSRKVKVFPVPAEWSKYGKRAGPIRNQHMLGQSPDLVVAFPGGRGTADMVKRARAAGVEVVEPLANHLQTEGLGR